MIADAPWVEGSQNTSFGRKFMWMSHGQKHVAHLTFFRKIPEHLNETSFIVNALPESKTISEIKLLHLLCIVICYFYRSFKVILEGGLLLWAKCTSKESKQSGFSPSISVHEKEKKQKRAALFAHYFSWLSVINYVNVIFLQLSVAKVARGAPNAKSCSKLAEHKGRVHF